MAESSEISKPRQYTLDDMGLPVLVQGTHGPIRGIIKSINSDFVVVSLSTGGSVVLPHQAVRVDPLFI